MPLEPPHPGKLADLLREQLVQIRLLIASDPGEKAYARAAEHVEGAIRELEGMQRSS